MAACECQMSVAGCTLHEHEGGRLADAQQRLPQQRPPAVAAALPRRWGAAAGAGRAAARAAKRVAAAAAAAAAFLINRGWRGPRTAEWFAINSVTAAAGWCSAAATAAQAQQAACTCNAARRCSTWHSAGHGSAPTNRHVAANRRGPAQLLTAAAAGQGNSGGASVNCWREVPQALVQAGSTTAAGAVWGHLPRLRHGHRPNRTPCAHLLSNTCWPSLRSPAKAGVEVSSTAAAPTAAARRGRAATACRRLGREAGSSNFRAAAGISCAAAAHVRAKMAWVGAGWQSAAAPGGAGAPAAQRHCCSSPGLGRRLAGLVAPTLGCCDEARMVCALQAAAEQTVRAAMIGLGCSASCKQDGTASGRAMQCVGGGIRVGRAVYQHGQHVNLAASVAACRGWVAIWQRSLMAGGWLGAQHASRPQRVARHADSQGFG